MTKVGDRWKLVEGTHWLLDFGPGQGNAIAALHFIRKYAFDTICFVGRPGPSMVYFKTHGRRRPVIELIDPRRIEAAIEPPRWIREQADAVAERSPALDLAAQCPGAGPSHRDFGQFTTEVRGAKESHIVERFGLSGLATEREIEIVLARPADVVDLGLAHFGEPPTAVGYAGDRESASVTMDRVQRQIENARLVGPAIDRVVITSPGGDAVLAYLRSQPAEGRRKKGK